jgi:hypothetical protein
MNLVLESLHFRKSGALQSTTNAMRVVVHFATEDGYIVVNQRTEPTGYLGNKG